MHYIANITLKHDNVVLRHSSIAGHRLLFGLLVIIFVVLVARILRSRWNLGFRVKRGDGNHPSNFGAKAFDGLKNFGPLGVDVALRNVGSQAPSLGGGIVHLHEIKGHAHPAAGSGSHPRLALSNYLVDIGW